VVSVERAICAAEHRTSAHDEKIGPKSTGSGSLGLEERWFTAQFVAQHPQVVERRMQQVIDTDAAVFLSVFDIYAETEMAPWLPEIKQPCLVLTG
jgi:hypothetical protein